MGHGIWSSLNLTLLSGHLSEKTANKLLGGISATVPSLSLLIPTHYKLFSWDEVEEGAWEDPDFLKPFEDKGKQSQCKLGTPSP